MSNDDLSPIPLRLKGISDVWWYEEPAGIAVVHEKLGTVVVIPWRMIRASLKRKDRKP